MPRVSVVIPAYNAARFLPDALASALSQTFQDHEIVLLDDGSTDGTGDLVKEWQERHPGRIRYFHQENRGLGAARNAAIERASGDLIALLDADDVWLPRRLEAGVAALDRDPAVGLVHGRMIMVDETLSAIRTPEVEPRFLSGRIRRHLITRRAHVSCPTVLFRKACLARTGLFDTHPAVHGCEDRDLWIRIAEHHTFAFVDEPLAHYRVVSGSLSSKREQMMKGRMYILDKHLGRSLADRLVRRQALANLWAEVADGHMERGERTPALRAYLRSFLAFPLSLRPPLVLAKYALHLDRLWRVRTA